ncbi:hypothetical protein RUM44_005803 [Polyplax serrata]|uniref:Serum response factor-binding protein 1 n=1 Tax=Polyplax serrata TaxID=468196 RepID=A0ABR1AZL4_POLSC
MDKNMLNNEIVLCRSAVRKARVIVIRKTLKHMKILKTCKNENAIEKKLKKAKKLYRRVQLMKKLKDDEVTKFALANEDYESFLKQSSKNMKKAALAALARHSAVANVVSEIREKIPDWKTVFPILLSSSKRKKVNNLKTNQEIATNEKMLQDLPCLVTTQNSGTNCKKVTKVSKSSSNETAKIKEQIQNSKTLKKITFVKERVGKDFKEKMNICDGHEENLQSKIDDPFFIQKKVFAPKQVQETLLKNESVYKQGRQMYDGFSRQSGLHNVPLNTIKHINKEVPEKNEVLHPSWAAKKIQLIKPFEGKKIMFSEDT